MVMDLYHWFDIIFFALVYTIEHRRDISEKHIPKFANKNSISLCICI